MLAQALAEVRRHPSRFLSTIIAVAISVAFLAGSAVMVATEAQAEGRALNVPIAGADIVIREASEGARAAIEATPGVVAAAPVLQLTEPVTAGEKAELMALFAVPPEALRWSRLTVGRWPQGASEVVLSKGAAAALGVAVGGAITGADGEEQLAVVGVTDEPSTLFTRTGYASAARFRQAGLDLETATNWAVKAAPGSDLPALMAELERRLPASPELDVELAEVARQSALDQLAGDFAIFTNLLWAFAAVALVVGMITIANTFSITLAQRRRQIGLLRAVGASGSQVRRRFFLEAAVLGLLGALLGLVVGVSLAAGGSAYTGSLFWGLALPLDQLAIAVALGLTATVAAAWVPIVRGTRVLPLEALQPVLAADEQRRAWRLRAVTCGVLLLAGAGVVGTIALSGTPFGFAGAIVAGALIALGILFGAPLFVPRLLRLTGRPVRRLGTVARLAAGNAERNPRRATATATALMLAVGLIVTLQVATASIRLTMLDHIEQQTPVDIAVAWSDQEGLPAPIPADARTRLAMAPGVAGSVLLAATQAELSSGEATFLVTGIGYDPAIQVVTGTGVALADDQVLVDDHAAEGLGKTAELRTTTGILPVRVAASPLAGPGTAILSAATLKRVGKVVPGAVLWLSVPDRSQAVDAMLAASAVVGPSGQLSGSIIEAATIERVLFILLTIITALLGVAVLIALIGVSNTLGLSVLERTRESALLRALGLQSRSLRGMLTLEALQVTLVGVLVGLAAGAFFGWLAVTSLGRSAGVANIRFAVDAPQTLGMLALAVVAAALASVLPGRRAAKAVPTEALADI